MTDPSDSTTMHPLTFIADFVVEAGDALHQLPLLTAARVVDEVAGQDLLQLAYRQHLDGLLRVQVGQRRPDPSLGGRAHLRNERRRE